MVAYNFLQVLQLHALSLNICKVFRPSISLMTSHFRGNTITHHISTPRYLSLSVIKVSYAHCEVSHTPRHREITYVTIPSQGGGEIYYMKVKILCAHELIINIHENEINLVWESTSHLVSYFLGEVEDLMDGWNISSLKSLRDISSLKSLRDIFSLNILEIPF